MTILDVVLAVKILGTGLFAGLPLVLLPAGMVTRIMKVDQNAMPYMRLYGVAILALLVGYSFGFSPVTGEVFPLGIVCMGIVSNGLGTLVLLTTGAYKDNLLMTTLVGSIATALIMCLQLPDLAMRAL